LRVKQAAKEAQKKVKEGYNYVSSAISGESQAKDMDPESRHRMEQRNEKFNEEREIARQRMDENRAELEARRLQKPKMSSSQQGRRIAKEGGQF